MHQHLSKFKAQGITHSIFGDIFLEDLRTYRENKLKEAGLEGIFPLWKKDTAELISEFIHLNYKTIIVCTQQNLKSICGKVINHELINELPVEIDPCGENGEFHTFAFEGPIFNQNIAFQLGETVFRTYHNPSKSNVKEQLKMDDNTEIGFWYIDLI